MKIKNIALACIASLSVGLAVAQPAQTKKTEPILTKVSAIEVAKTVIPTATKLEKYDKYWFKIMDQSNKVAGYAMSSEDYCKNVQGYNNTTPVLIVIDKKFVIKKVALLSNYETLAYVRRLEKMGFFTNWADLKIAEAKNIKVDAYAGATITARAVEKNVNFLLENGGKKLPK